MLKNFIKKNLNNFFLGSAGENFIKIEKKDLKKNYKQPFRKK